MKRRSQVRQSIAVSAVLMVLLFTLPLAVIGPFREEQFGGEKTADETEGDPFASGESDGSVVLWAWCGRRCRPPLNRRR